MRTLHYFALVITLTLYSHSARALTVNRVNGGASIVYVDFSLPGTAIPLELIRSYNSITALNENSGWSGVFGWGWTSPIETTLTVTPERQVVLRDGGTGNNIVFRPRKESNQGMQTFIEALKKAYYEEKRGGKMTAAELSKLTLPAKMLAQIQKDPSARQELGRHYKLQIPPPVDVLVSSEYGYQTIQFKNNQWIRERDGITQFLDADGRLVRQIDKNGTSFEFEYSKANPLQVVEIRDRDKISSLKLTWTGERISEITDNRGFKARYAYDGIGNLVRSTDSRNQTYLYQYQSKKFPHLLTRIDYPGETQGKNLVFREIRYDDVGLVISTREKSGEESFYAYGRNPTNADNNFWTKVVTKDPSGKASEFYEEFLLKVRDDGTKYLYKQDTRQDGVTTSTLFTACCGKPSQITKNGKVTTFKYTEEGLLKEKVGGKEELKFEYDPRWKKVTKVIQNGFESTYTYDSRGNLAQAANSRGQKVALTYDRLGRIVEMRDKTNRKIAFTYGSNGKPVLISEKGVGTIRIQYSPDGRIAKTETLNSKNNRQPTTNHQEIVQRVMSGFQNLLDILRPAGLSISAISQS